MQSPHADEDEGWVKSYAPTGMTSQFKASILKRDYKGVRIQMSYCNY